MIQFDEHIGFKLGVVSFLPKSWVLLSIMGVPLRIRGSTK